jgi:HlyD family secretion protein
MKYRKIWIPAAMLAMALLTWAFVHSRGSDAESYRLVSVDAGSVESVVTSTGVLQPTETVEVGTQVSGQIAALYVDFNDAVTKGQLLARIDPTILQQEVQSAQASVMRNQAEVDQATRALKRGEELFEERVITQIELEQAQYSHTVALASLSSAQVALQRARQNLSYTEIRAPIDGIIVERTGDLGQTVAASMSAPTLFLLAQDLSEMQILASVDEGDIGRINTGQAVRFTVQAYGDRKFAGTVRQVRLQSKTQDNVVSYSVVIQVDNADGKLLPAMTATVEFIVAQATDVLKVPNAALRVQPTDVMRATVAAARAQRDDARAATQLAGVATPTTGTPGTGTPTTPGARGAAGPGTGAGMGAGAGARSGSGAGDSTRGALWYVDEGGRPAMIPVRIGLTDGQYTEISGPEVVAGMQVIAGVIGGSATGAAAPNPFQSTQPRAPTGPGGAPRF